MKVAMIGCGKLGLMCALAMESKGHEVMGYDISAHVVDILESKKLPYVEAGGDELLQKTKIKVLSSWEAVKFADIIFIAVQTPHDKEYEGITPVPEERRDFDYTYLINAFKEVAGHLKEQGVKKVVSIISTVLPGTIRRELLPLSNEFVQLVYNPYFIAMGTTIQDFLNPEFVLMGSDDKDAVEQLSAFYDKVHFGKHFKCTIEEAEMIKVCYNTFITTKICFANTIMELSHKIGNINCDRITEALSLATDRIISPKYLKGGMPDAGGCHPRDLIAMSYISQKANLFSEFYDNLIHCREDQTLFLAQLIKKEHQRTQLPIVILGKAFKKNTNLTVGSGAYLLTHYLGKMPYRHFDPLVDITALVIDKAIYFIATEHDCFKNFDFPAGSIVIDPFRFIERKEHFTLIQIGKT